MKRTLLKSFVAMAIVSTAVAALAAPSSLVTDNTTGFCSNAKIGAFWSTYPTHAKQTSSVPWTAVRFVCAQSPDPERSGACKADVYISNDKNGSCDDSTMTTKIATVSMLLSTGEITVVNQSSTAFTLKVIGPGHVELD